MNSESTCCQVVTLCEFSHSSSRCLIVREALSLPYITFLFKPPRWCSGVPLCHNELCLLTVAFLLCECSAVLCLCVPVYACFLKYICSASESQVFRGPDQIHQIYQMTCITGLCSSLCVRALILGRNSNLQLWYGPPAQATVPLPLVLPTSHRQKPNCLSLARYSWWIIMWPLCVQ